MNAGEMRMKTSLLGFSARDLERIFTDLHDAAAILTGQKPVPSHVAEIVNTWWEETMTAVENQVQDAQKQAALSPQIPIRLHRYAHHAHLPRTQGAQASSLQAWDFHLGLIVQRLEELGIEVNVITLTEP